MKIGILTYPFNANYGGILQNYALQTILKKSGYKVETICTNNLIVTTTIRQFLAITVRLIRKYILWQHDIIINREKLLNEENREISKYTDEFINKHIKIRKVDNIYKDVKPQDYFALIVGSDQVWRKNYNTMTYFLDFTNNWRVKRISYAASFGTDVWEYGNFLTRRCKKCINKFNGVSVREKTAVSLCRDKFGVKATWVLDPTLLLKREDYENLILSEYNKGKGKIFSYILDRSEDKNTALCKLCDILKKETFSINADVYNRNLPIEERIQPGVEEWLSSIRNADYVFTDSFHGMVFSIIFRKPFFVYGNSERGLTRFESLLGVLGINDFLIQNSSEISKEIVTKNIDYVLVEKKLEELKRMSIKFLELYV